MARVRSYLRFTYLALLTLLPSLALAQVRGANGREKEFGVWVKGTVRDEAGRPIAGAMVYARATYHGGLRMNGLLQTAVSDAKGSYTIEGQTGLSSFSATLVASLAGRPPALSWFSLPEARQFDALGFEI
jgi:hypothetical protein